MTASDKQVLLPCSNLNCFSLESRAPGWLPSIVAECDQAAVANIAAAQNWLVLISVSDVATGLTRIDTFFIVSVSHIEAHRIAMEMITEARGSRPAGVIVTGITVNRATWQEAEDQRAYLLTQGTVVPCSCSGIQGTGTRGR